MTDTPETPTFAALFLRRPHSWLEAKYKCIEVDGWGLTEFEPGETYTLDQVLAFPHKERIKVILDD